MRSIAVRVAKSGSAAGSSTHRLPMQTYVITHYLSQVHESRSPTSLAQNRVYKQVSGFLCARWVRVSARAVQQVMLRLRQRVNWPNPAAACISSTPWPQLPQTHLPAAAAGPWPVVQLRSAAVDPVFLLLQAAAVPAVG